MPHIESPELEAAPSLLPALSPAQRRASSGASAPAAKLQLRGLHFYFNFGKKHVLKGIDLTIPDRSVTALIGPSGCGKSTLLRVLNRIYELYPEASAAGEVLLDGANILDPAVDLALLRTRIGMVFQKPTPFPMSIYENIAYGLRLYEKPSRSEIRERVELALRRAALWDEVKDILSRSGLSLSGGQQQRLCIARTIAVGPEVILFDEPCSALDPISTRHIEALIEDLKQDFCIVIVTHNLQQAARISDITAFMYRGSLIEVAPTETLFTHPARHETEAYVSGRYG